MTESERTVFYDHHLAQGAKMVDFAGWDMPIFYPTGIVAEHLNTRKHSGLFDVSHMGRFIIKGDRALPFLQHVLTNNAAALDVGMAQYTIVPDETGGALDDAYLYRFFQDEFLLVVNAANREKVWSHFQTQLENFEQVQLDDVTRDLVMLALQGPGSKGMLAAIREFGIMPEPMRNYLGIIAVGGADVLLARTGYTGEPLCYELFTVSEHGPMLWDLLLEKGARPAGLGARDTLRLEAGLPLYGHELGPHPDGGEIPVFACPLGRFAVSFSPLKGDYIGREALHRQFEALKRIMRRDYSQMNNLPQRIQPFAMIGRGVARAGAPVFRNGKPLGAVTSGTTVPMWDFQGKGLTSTPGDTHKLRAVGLALMDSDVLEDDRVIVEIRGKQVEAVVVPYHLRSEAPPYARPIVHGVGPVDEPDSTGPEPSRAAGLLRRALDNTRWRRSECVNLIPSEMTPSPMVRRLSVLDPAGRYAEHRKSEAFYEAEIFYYQGTEFIAEVERLLEREMIKFMGCTEVETRLVSGQMANTAVFSAMMDYLNRVDRRREPRRIGMVMNNHIGKGGHLSAQPMGALRDFVARDPRTERPAVVNFPVMQDDRFRIDVSAALDLIEICRPEMIILGKSMMLYKEPLADIRRCLNDLGLDTVVLYDMAHVLGLIGPHFQEPFQEGADLVTGSTHKTFFGPQRGVAGSCFLESEERYELWEALLRRTFPGSVSNHHLGTLLGLLMAAYEMNHFKDQYQEKVLAHAKILASALHHCGLDVAGDPSLAFTETHQVIVNVGYAQGPDIARRLEANNIICNYQAGPDEEGFTASGALRLGVAEMTRFGMGEPEFQSLAQLMADVIRKGADVRDQVRAMRAPFVDLHYCFSDEDVEGLLEQMHEYL